MAGDPVFSERLNWYGLVAEGVILCKDGSLLAGWNLSGIDTESLGSDEVGARTLALARGMTEFKAGDAFWVDLARRPLRGYSTTEADFPPGVLQVLEGERRAYFERAQDENYRNAITLVYQWQAGSGLSLERALEEFDRRCLSVEGRFGAIFGLARMGLVREADGLHGIDVGRDELVGRLSSALTGRFRKVQVPKLPIYLDVILRPEWAHERPGELPYVCGRRAAFIAIDGYPAESTPEMLATLEDLPLEYSWTTRFMPLSGDAIRGEIDRRARAWGQTKTSVASQLSRSGGGIVNEFTETMEMEARSALADVEAGELRYGFFNTTISIFEVPLVS